MRGLHLPVENFGQVTTVASVRRRGRARVAGVVVGIVVSEWASIALAHALGL